MPLMSFADYARHRGVSRAAVTQAMKRGRITVTNDPNGKRCIDSGAADLQWQENTDHAFKRTGPISEASPELPGPTTDTEAKSEPEQKPNSTYNQNRTIREHYAARIAKLSYEERSGTLVNAEEVQNAAFKIGRVIRDTLLSIPDRVSAELAAETNQFKLHTRLTEEIRKALIGLKEAT